MKKIFNKPNRQLLKAGFVAGVFVSFFIYLVMRIIFYEFRFSVQEELLNLAGIVGTGGIVCCLQVLLLLLIEYVIGNISIAGNIIAEKSKHRKSSIAPVYKHIEQKKVLTLHEEVLSNAG